MLDADFWIERAADDRRGASALVLDDARRRELLELDAVCVQVAEKIQMRAPGG